MSADEFFDEARRQAEAQQLRNGEGFERDARVRSGSMFPIAEQDLIDNIGVALSTELPPGVERRDLVTMAIEWAMAVEEGLKFGLVVDWGNPSEVRFYEALFATAETSVQRPRFPYLEQAIEQSLASVVRQKRFEAWSGGVKEVASTDKEVAKMDAENSESWRVKLDVARQTRRLVDLVFVQRQNNSGNAEWMAALATGQDYGGRMPVVTPDKEHWEEFFEVYGRALDPVLRQIVVAGMTEKQLTEARKKLGDEEANQRGIKKIEGIKDGIYARGLTANSKEFKVWLKHMWDVAGGRMDVVWMAWKLALSWELVSTVGAIVVQEGGKYVIKMADPPIGGDGPAGWWENLRLRRIREFGCEVDEDGMPLFDKRLEATKLMSHSGLPVSIAPIQGICSNFLVESAPEVGGEKVSLWNLWWGRGVSLQGLPWAATDKPAGTGEMEDEMPPNSFLGYLLKRYRAEKVTQTLRKMFETKDLNSDEFIPWKLTRDWRKVFGKSEQTSPEDNPRSWWYLSQIVVRYKDNRGMPLTSSGLQRGAAEDKTYLVGVSDQKGVTDAQTTSGGASKNSHRVAVDHGLRSGFFTYEMARWFDEMLVLPEKEIIKKSIEAGRRLKRDVVVDVLERRRVKLFN